MEVGGGEAGEEGEEIWDGEEMSGVGERDGGTTDDGARRGMLCVGCERQFSDGKHSFGASGIKTAVVLGMSRIWQHGKI